MTATVQLDVRLVAGPITAAPPPPPAGAGGECVFVGRTRPERHDRLGPLRTLRYEAYAPMAEKVLEDLARRGAERFGCSVVRVHHAVGEVGPGEASVLVQVACGHRAEAFAACRFLIDELKRTAPIWKHEIWADGATWSRGAAVGPEGGDR